MSERHAVGHIFRALRPHASPPIVVAAAQQDSVDTAADAALVRQAEVDALALDNRGPLMLTEDGKLAPQIVNSFERHGFYVLTGVIQREELLELRAEVKALLADTTRALVPPSRWNMATPLSDPTGGRGRSPGTRMRTYAAAADAPATVPRSLTKCLPNSDAALRLFGHPSLLAAAATLLGDDFAPGAGPSFQIKLPGLGPAVAWHQDGSHGFNFMAQLYSSTAENGVWVLPGSHSGRHRHDIVRLEQSHGDRFPGALPMIAAPGDVCIADRMVLHCSYPNVSRDKRVTLNLGWQTSRDADEQNQSPRRRRLIPIAIAARAARYPEEQSFVAKDNPSATFCPERWDQAMRQVVSELS